MSGCSVARLFEGEPPMSATYETLREHVFSLDVIDTHEHLPPFEKDRPRDTDVLAEYLRHYFSCDLVSAGLSDDGIAFVRDHTKPLKERWETVAPYWSAARNTGYGRSLDVTVRELYGIDEINGMRTRSPDLHDRCLSPELSYAGGVLSV